MDLAVTVVANMSNSKFTYTRDQLQVIALLAGNQCAISYSSVRGRLSEEDLNQLVENRVIRVSNGESDESWEKELLTLECNAIRGKFPPHTSVCVLNSITFAEVYRLFWSWGYKGQ